MKTFEATDLQFEFLVVLSSFNEKIDVPLAGFHSFEAATAFLRPRALRSSMKILLRVEGNQYRDYYRYPKNPSQSPFIREDKC